MTKTPRSRIRVLALDIDGTLLDGRGELRPRTAKAIARAAASGIRPVLCTGRRYRRARPIAEMLDLVDPLVCNSGALIKGHHDGRTLWRADFDPLLTREVFALFRQHDEPAVGFSDRHPADFDFVVEQDTTGRPHFDEYVELNREHARVDPGWSLRGEPQFHVCAIGDRPKMLHLESAVVARLGGSVRTFVQRSPAYSGTMCEILRGDASKWAAILHLADLWGIAADEICAVGDDMNDLPMIAGAGFGVAMAHAPEVVRNAADHVTLGNDEDGVAVLIEDLLLG